MNFKSPRIDICRETHKVPFTNLFYYKKLLWI